MLLLRTISYYVAVLRL